MTQKQKILTLISKDPSAWYYPVDFMSMSLGKLFVGYEASARLSELASDFPEHIESERDGKFIKRRVRSLVGLQKMIAEVA